MIGTKHELFVCCQILKVCLCSRLSQYFLFNSVILAVAVKLPGDRESNGAQAHLLYTDGVFCALFTPVSDQIGAVPSLLQLHLGLVSLQRSCKPEPPVNNYCTYTAINHSEHEDENSRYHQWNRERLVGRC